jgi:hypothetical protein
VLWLKGKPSVETGQSHSQGTHLDNLSLGGLVTNVPYPFRSQMAKVELEGTLSEVRAMSTPPSSFTLRLVGGLLILVVKD